MWRALGYIGCIAGVLESIAGINGCIAGSVKVYIGVLWGDGRVLGCIAEWC